MFEDEDQDLSDIDLTECLGFLEIVSADEHPNLEIPLYPNQEVLIGRDHQSDYTITDNRVSKRHFRLYSILYEYRKHPDFPPLIYCEDLESFNGTYVNEVLIGKISQERKGYLLCDGDEIEIRPFWKFRFHQENHQLLVRDRTQWQELKQFRDRYILSERKLGCGRYGDVFLATEVATSKQVACKIIDLKLAMAHISESHPFGADGGSWESTLQFARKEKRRVLREIKILAKLSHPNVIDLKKAFCSHNALYIFTELASGGDLYSYMRSKGGVLNDYNSRVISRQVALALQHIHSKGIAHRDIKAENVLVSGTHFGGRVILTDFGFAIHANVITGRMLSKVGTDGYVAPEVEAVEKSNIGYTKSADMWSLGVLTACMLTGSTLIPRNELNGLSKVEIVERHFGVDDSRAKLDWLTMPPRALRFILRLLIIEPEERMTADEAITDSWFTKPLGEAQALNEGIENICRFWRKRESDDVLLEGLSGVVLSTPAFPDTHALRPRRKIPDTSMSPYFGLDRHLQQRVLSMRKRLLEDLSQSGLPFVDSKDPHLKNYPKQRASRRGQCKSVISVEGSDIFAKSTTNTVSLDPVPEVDEVDLVPTTPMSRIKNAWSFNINDSLSPATSPVNASNSTGSPGKKRARKESEDQRIHDAAAKGLSRLSTAKELSTAVQKVRKFGIYQGSSVPAI